MNIVPTQLPGVLVIEPKVFSDERGFFFESYNARILRSAGIEFEFVQDNQSYSRRNVLRGLHYQVHQPQGKLVRAVFGEVLDVVVDLRRSSAAFGHWQSFVLSMDNRRILWVPPGFAHGFVARSEAAHVLYKTTDYWAPEHERTIAWNDPDLAIEWQLSALPILSGKDRQGLRFCEAEVYP